MRTVDWNKRKIGEEIEAKMKAVLKREGQKTDKAVFCSTAPVNLDTYKLMVIYVVCSCATQAAHITEKTVNSYIKNPLPYMFC